MTYSGSVHAFQTNSTVASKVRVTIRSWVADLLPIISLLQIGNADFLHLQHRVDDAFCLDGIRVAHQLAHLLRDDLPGQAELVLTPAALLRFRNGRQLVPEVIHLFLVLTFDV